MDIDWIEPGALAASRTPYDLDDLRSLRDQGIKAIITLLEDPLPAVIDIPPGIFGQLDIAYHHVPIPDGLPPEMIEADQIVKLIDQMKAEGRPVLIHCHAGMGRTGTLLHVYFLAHGMPLNDAQRRVSERRSVCTFSLLTDHQQTFLYKYADAKKRGNTNTI